MTSLHSLPPRDARNYTVLVAEDDEHDVIAIRRAWRKLGIANPLVVVHDGEACMDYLRARPPFEAATLPGLILLDLHMPRLDGLGTLRAIRGNPPSARLPVIILTTSQAEEDRVKSYDLGANAYIVKPVGFENFTTAIRTINEFWNLVELPGEKK